MSAAAIVDLARRLGRAMAEPGATAESAAAAAGDPEPAALAVHVRPEVTAVDHVTITRRWESEEPNAAHIELVPPLPLAELEAESAESRTTARGGPGDDAVILHEDPAFTVFAELDGDGNAARVIVRRDG